MNAVTEPDVFVYAVDIASLSCCTALDDQTTATEVNRSHPTGVGPWAVSRYPFADGTPNPCECNTDPTRRHLLFVC